MGCTYEKVHGCSAQAADLEALRSRLQVASGNRGSEQHQLGPGQFIVPPAPVGLHVTIRAKCKPAELLGREWHFRITGVAHFTHPKIGSPSQWDPSWTCARWFALEVAWEGECAELCRGSWPHIAVSCCGFYTRKVNVPRAGSAMPKTKTRRSKLEPQRALKKKKKKKKTKKKQKKEKQTNVQGVHKEACC